MARRGGAATEGPASRARAVALSARSFLSMASPFRFEGRWFFSVPPDELWRAFSQTERFPQWWPWLRILESGGLVEGTVSRCVLRGPVPYALSLNIAILEVVPPRCVVTTVSGDLEGPAWLDVVPQDGGSEARMSWVLEVRAPLLRAAALVARPVMNWGHNWVVDTGVRQFRRQALGAPGSSHD